uniref:Uncharacterized protein n=1 Tax=Geobacter sp. (strain M21) TaxID=443144 RepID=C6E948_GEOSM
MRHTYLVPKLQLGNPRQSKLQLGAGGSWSFYWQCVPKVALGNEIQFPTRRRT